MSHRVLVQRLARKDLADAYHYATRYVSCVSAVPNAAPGSNRTRTRRRLSMTAKTQTLAAKQHAARCGKCSGRKEQRCWQKNASLIPACPDSSLAGNHPTQSVKSRQARRREHTTIASVEAHFSDRDSPATLSFQDLAVANPVAGCFPEDFVPPIVTTLDWPYGHSSGTPGIQD